MKKPFRTPVVFHFLITIFVSIQIGFAQDSTIQTEGLRSNPPKLTCLVNGHVHTPQGLLENQSILIEDGKIVQLGDFTPPSGCKKIDLNGKHVYPGFVDPCVPKERAWERPEESGYWNDRITPEYRIVDDFAPSIPGAKDLRKLGITVVGLVPDSGIIRGQGAVVLLTDNRPNSLLNESFGQHVELTVQRRRGSGYPNSPMGAVALARQTFLDANWYQEAWQVANANKSLPRPETNASLESLASVVDGQIPIIVHTSNELFALRADRFAREFGLRLIIKGSGNEYRRLAEVARTQRQMILPIDFPTAPEVATPEAALDVGLETLMHWDHAPENPARLANAQVNFAITSEGSGADFLKNLRKAVQRGLDKSIALAAITRTPAEMMGVDAQVGTIEVGKFANFAVMSDEIWNEKSKVTHTLVAGTVFEIESDKTTGIAGNWEFSKGPLKDYVLVVTDDKFSAKFEKRSAGKKLSKAPQKSRKKAKKNESKNASADKKANADDGNVNIKNARFVADRFTGTFNTTEWKKPGISQLGLVRVSKNELTGRIVFPDGSSTRVIAKRATKPALKTEKQVVATSKEKAKPGKAAKTAAAADEKTSVAATYPVNYPLGAYGFESEPTAPLSVLLKNVTVWTCGDRGVLNNGAVLFGDGLIQGVYSSDEDLPDADLVIDGKGQHLTPGIIDCHSHMATDSGVNESGQANTAEVRIGDLVDCDDINIYRQLAGGVTAVNILHGSANPIGGQNQVIKLRWGATDEEMKFENAPAGIKFALGENVKQSNRPNSTTRYPQTRMGVEQMFVDAFEAAIVYRQRHNEWKKTRIGLPPRIDLELETIGEIVEGKRWIHCHSYRQDEILALIRVLDKYGITIGSFQHILEGYKVADEMAKHGAMASAFADWWAYKYEVIDGIPYAGALMHDAGVIVSFNSDDGELGRHLNHEAAKAVRYGGVPAAEALKFVTLNPARQLRIDDRVGSIEIGKDADMVLWSGDPLSNLSRCEQTWIDGKKYFDRQQDMDARKQNMDKRLTLIQKILMSGEKMEATGGGRFDPAKLWPRYDEFCHGHKHGDEHLHDEDFGFRSKGQAHDH